MRQVSAGKVKVLPRREMLDLVVVDGNARGVVCRNLVNGQFETYAGHAVLLCTGGYGNVFYLSTNAKGCNVTASWRAHKRGAFFANPCYTQIHPTCIPVHGDYQSKLTLMSESLRNDGRVWVPKDKGDQRRPVDIPEEDRDYYLERRYPTYGNMVPRDVASRAAKERCDAGYGVGSTKMAVYLDFSRAIEEQGEDAIRRKYGNLFAMYEKITDDNGYKTPMMIYPAVHYTMGGLWVDYHLQSTIPGLFVLGEANFSDHGANRLGASALMQGLADGYFVAPYTVGHHLASQKLKPVTEAHPKFKETMIDARGRLERILAVSGTRTVTDLHRELGQIMWNRCGMSRNAEGIEASLSEIRELREEFWRTIKVLGSGEAFNQNLEYAGRLADFLEFAEIFARDALEREESAGGHFREEHQTEEGEAKRDDENFCHVSAWEFQGDDSPHTLHKEPLEFENVELTTRSYK